MLYTLHTSNANEFLMHFNDYTSNTTIWPKKTRSSKKNYSVCRICSARVQDACIFTAALRFFTFLLSATTKLQATTITKLLLHKYPNQCKKTHLPIATLTIYSSGRNSFLAGQPLKDNDITIVITSTFYTLKWSLHLDIPVLFFSYWHNY